MFKIPETFLEHSYRISSISIVLLWEFINRFSKTKRKAKPNPELIFTQN